ncbi:MAG: HlyD family efflux transporter periplasmic adaptor subunit [Ideonella sp.]|nr:HlyD family efflux transporter periplasmic adaptor subunit [Ideonella sp.]MCC7457347.1 HlyD family efflux transporter periplasmic adaptor subunit [Nitrospira sp.]
MNTPAPLFRPEVLAARAAPWLGSIRIARPPSHAVVTGVSVALAIALIVFAAWAEVTRKARVPGFLTPVSGTLQVAAAAAGVVQEQRVAEGRFVQVREPMFVLDTSHFTAGGDAGQRVAASIEQRMATLRSEQAARERQARARLRTIAERTEALRAESLRVEHEIALLNRRLLLSRSEAGRFEGLAAQGFVSGSQLQAKQQEVLDIQARVEVAERTGIALRRDALALQAEAADARAQVDAERAQIERSLAALSQEAVDNEAQRQAVIVAPQAGVVTAIAIHRGQAVQPGQTLATLVPQSQDGTAAALEAQLYAPSRAAGFVRPGQTVWLRYAAFPYQKFGLARGEVSSVSRTPINPQDLPAGQQQALLLGAQGNEPLYRISVALPANSIVADGVRHPLKAGMTLEADVVRDRRAVWEWLLEPVLAVRRQAMVQGVESI